MIMKLVNHLRPKTCSSAPVISRPPLMVGDYFHPKEAKKEIKSYYSICLLYKEKVSSGSFMPIQKYEYFSRQPKVMAVGRTKDWLWSKSVKIWSWRSYGLDRCRLFDEWMLSSNDRWIELRFNFMKFYLFKFLTVFENWQTTTSLIQYSRTKITALFCASGSRNSTRFISACLLF